MTNHNDFTVSDISGRFRMKVFLASPGPESIPATCERAIAALQEEHRLPATPITISAMNASSNVSGVVFVDVEWRSE